jgi:hypothetical protein
LCSMLKNFEGLIKIKGRVDLSLIWSNMPN